MQKFIITLLFLMPQLMQGQLFLNDSLLSKETALVAQKISSLEMLYLTKNNGWSTVEDYSCTVYMMHKATVPELLRLIDYENKYVKCYAVYGLSARSNLTIDFYNIILKNITDKKEIICLMSDNKWAQTINLFVKSRFYRKLEPYQKTKIDKLINE